MGNRLIRIFIAPSLFALAGIGQANAVINCNSPSGFLQSIGTFNTGDFAIFGPDCNHLQSATLSLNLTLNSLTIGTATLSAPNSDSVWQLTGSGNNVSTAFHLNPGTGTITSGTISEFVAQTTNAQAFGGNYGRISFGAVGSSNGFEMGVFGEFGGTTATGSMGPFVIQNAVENPAGTFTLTEFLRGITIAGGSEDTNLGAVNIGINATTSQNLLVLNAKVPSIAGTLDSSAFLFAGKSFDGVTARAEYWRQKVNVTSQAGASQFVWHNNLNGAGYTQRMALTDGGVLNVQTGYQINGVAAATTIGTTSAPLGGSVTALAGLTSVQTANVTGGTAASSALALQSTSGVGTSDKITMSIGNNGASQVLTIRNSDATCGVVGCIVIGTGSSNPNYLTQIAAPSGAHALLQFTNATTGYTNAVGTYFGVLNGETQFRIANLSNEGIEFITNNNFAMKLYASGGISLNTAGGQVDPGATNFSAGGFVQTGVSTVAGLPTCNASTKGARRFVTDANLATYHSTAVGGGTNQLGVTCDGTNWYLSANDNFKPEKMAS
ncbi:MAG: hypothetical protein KGJ13_07705 [Patescibacteria group bacterium]|nr:hypothetical protein [Patescibacteria group bacterium]